MTSIPKRSFLTKPRLGRVPQFEDDDDAPALPPGHWIDAEEVGKYLLDMLCNHHHSLVCQSAHAVLLLKDSMTFSCCDAFSGW